jgi:hypothetical protein
MTQKEVFVYCMAVMSPNKAARRRLDFYQSRQRDVVKEFVQTVLLPSQTSLTEKGNYQLTMFERE